MDASTESTGVPKVRGALAASTAAEASATQAALPSTAGSVSTVVSVLATVSAGASAVVSLLPPPHAAKTRKIGVQKATTKIFFLLCLIFAP
jgi:hypothetical protein